MKGYKTLVPIALVVCLLLSFYMLVNTRSSTKAEYESYLAAARNYAKQGIVVDAVVNYSKALAMEESIEINLEVGNLYVEMDDNVASIIWGEQMVEKFPNSPQAYEFLLTRYRNVNDFNRCFALYDVINKKELHTPEIIKIMDDIKYQYYYGEGYDDVSVYSEGYCAVEYEGTWGLANEHGETVSPMVFEKVGPFIDGLSPVISTDDEVYYVDYEGNKKMIIMVDFEVADASSVVGDVYAIKDGESWAFFNKKYEKLSGDYEAVSLMANGVAAVKSNDKWEIVDKSFKPLFDKKYMDVIQDDRGIILRNNVMFVNEGDQYYMIDGTGKKIGTDTYEDAHLFMDTTYAAVKTEKGWTFIDSSGKIVFSDLYFDDARSFSNGFAAVKKNGRWGYLDIDGNVAIDFLFEEAKDFNPSGCAFIKNEDFWQMIRLYSLNYET